MLDYFYQLWIQLVNIVRKFFGFDSQSGGSWQHQTQAVGGPFRANQSEPSRFRTHTSHTKKYTPEEVKRCLRGLEKSERVGVVMAEAARLSTMLNENMRHHFRGRERIFDRLPYVLFQYTQGKPSYDIARSVSYFSDGDDVEDAMLFVARLITPRVNRMR